jgi:hypothetical protein
MKGILFLTLAASTLIFSSCGADNDAKDVCNCYKEVLKLKGDEEAAKMKECIDLLNNYTEKHKEAGTLDDFNKAYDDCR